ncbi:hypothetical protein ACM2VE_13370 [Escherichia coli]
MLPFLILLFCSSPETARMILIYATDESAARLQALEDFARLNDSGFAASAQTPYEWENPHGARLLLVKNDWHGPVPFSLRGAKPGPVGIDESSSFSEETLRQNAENLKERGVVYTAQSIDKAAKVAANLPNRRVLLIMIGKT